MTHKRPPSRFGDEIRPITRTYKTTPADVLAMLGDVLAGADPPLATAEDEIVGGILIGIRLAIEMPIVAGQMLESFDKDTSTGIVVWNEVLLPRLLKFVGEPD